MSWAAQEFAGLELGDARRPQRLIKLADDLSAQPMGSIPLACGGWAETKAANRPLDNPAVDWREILEVHTTRTVARMAGQPVVLCLQDRTELDFTSQPGIAGLGRLSYEAQHGWYGHPTRAVRPAGVVLLTSVGFFMAHLRALVMAGCSGRWARRAKVPGNPDREATAGD